MNLGQETETDTGRQPETESVGSVSGVRCDDSTGLSLCDSRVLTHVTHDEEQRREAVEETQSFPSVPV